jgi:hypothetical protein
MTTRVNWTFTPRLSLEMVAQPFVNAGRYETTRSSPRPARSSSRATAATRAPVTDAYDVLRNSAGVAVDSVRIGRRIDPDGAGASPSFVVQEQNFTFRSLRGSAVVRWEYRPGSALFFVWQQQRTGQTQDGSFVGDRDIGGIFREPAQNVFLVKATYWLAR